MAAVNQNGEETYKKIIINICKAAKYKDFNTKEKTQVVSFESEPHLPRLVNVVVSFIYFAYFMQVLLAKDGDWEVINL